MARIRTIKPQHVTDKELSKISLQAHLFWVLSWCFSDDEGVLENDPLFLKSQLFPRRNDIRLEQIEQWIDQLVKARFMIPFTHNSEGYLLQRTFKTHQKIDRPQPSKIPDEVLESVRRTIVEQSTNDQPCRVEESNSKVLDRAKALVGSTEPTRYKQAALKKRYQEICDDLKEKPKSECWNEIKSFIQNEKPEFIEPYVDAWNLFADSYKLTRVDQITDKRRKKFMLRIVETGFDFLQILSKIKSSSFMRGDNQNQWKVDFNFIIHSEDNYVKILEGKYE